MSEVFVFHPIKKGSKNEKKQRREKFLNRLLWIVIVSLLLVALFQILFQFVISPGIKINNIVILPDDVLKEALTATISKDEILSIAGIEKNKYYFSLNLKEMEQALGNIPVIKSAKVERIFPDTLRLHLYGRQPLAVALVDQGGRSVPVAFDEEGVVFLEDRGITQWNLPVVSGLKFNGFKAGMKLPKQLQPFLNEVKLLQKDYGSLFNLVSEILIEPVGSMDYELVLYFIPYKTAVRIGRRITGEQLGYAMMVLNVLNEGENSRGEDIKEIDFRTNEVVYKEEGGESH